MTLSGLRQGCSEVQIPMEAGNCTAAPEDPEGPRNTRSTRSYSSAMNGYL